MPTDVNLARQPIFDRDIVVCGYELLSRSSSLLDHFSDLDPSAATGRVIGDAFLNLDLRGLTDGLPAYINFTRDRLVDASVRALPADAVVIEVLDGVEADEEVVAACRALGDAGYRLALDDWVGGDLRRPLLEVVHEVKIDMPATDAAQRRALVRLARDHGLRVTAEKVETRAQYAEAAGLGCDAFQGYFFQQPALVRGKRMAPALPGHLQLLALVDEPIIDYDAIAQLIKHDIALSWKFVNYINTVWFGWRQRVDSVRQALVLLGDRGVRQWVSLTALAGVAEEQPGEVVTTAVIRARACELLARELEGVAPLDALLGGMFSLIDVLLDEPMADALGRVSVPGGARAALLDGQGPLAGLLAAVRAYERGDWEAAGQAADAIGLPASGIGPRYLEAVTWAQRVSGELAERAV